ncbi:MAG: hypothetical protein D3923_17840, partial [Candidatus Electrothrix sp. AR3]|nr:hypothetical protein [Candidatus Electrothrix sp. AR3]
MNRFYQYIFFVALLCIPALGDASAGKKKANSPPITISLPAPTLRQTLRRILPLPIALNEKKSKFQGTISLDSISRLEIGKNMISVSGQLSGRNMVMEAQVGSQSIQIKLGQLVLPVTCELSLSFDPASRMLLLFPRFQKTSHNKADDSVVSLLNSLSKEYAVPLDGLAPLIWQLGEESVYLYLKLI